MAAIWFNKELKFEDLGKLTPNTMSEYLGMQWEELGDDFIKMSMPVDARTKQPYGFLHGGASCALAETIGSVASHLVMDASAYRCVGLEINANHLKSATAGRVVAVAKALHLGKTTHVWDVKINDENDKLICVSRLTVAVIPIKK